MALISLFVSQAIITTIHISEYPYKISLQLQRDEEIQRILAILERTIANGEVIHPIPGETSSTLTVANMFQSSVRATYSRFDTAVYQYETDDINTQKRLHSDLLNVTSLQFKHSKDLKKITFSITINDTEYSKTVYFIS